MKSKEKKNKGKVMKKEFAKKELHWYDLQVTNKMVL